MAEEQPTAPSKSARKRAARAVVALADELVGLSDELCRKIIMDEELLSELAEARRLSGTGAGRRQKLLVAKILRRLDTRAIAEAAHQMHAGHRQQVEEFRMAERWRDILLAHPEDGLRRLVLDHADIEIDRMRVLLNDHASTHDPRRRKHFARALFRELRDALSTAARD